MSDGLKDELALWLHWQPETATDFAGQSLVVYGAGGFGRLVGSLLEQAGATIRYFIDQQPRTDFPWPVKTLLQLDAADIRAADAVVLGIFNPVVNPQDVLGLLGKAGFANILSPVQLFQRIAHLAPASQYWLTLPSGYRPESTAILAALDYFDEPASRRLYVDLWRYRLTGELNQLPAPTSQDRQYFPEDIPPWPLPLRFIDCGAYTGDTLRYIHDCGMPVAAVAAFEPDPDNYRKLVAGFPAWQGLQSSFLAPCGVHARAAQLKFMADGSAAAAVAADGNMTIQCVAIDECLPQFAPNLIKMDVEGAEMDALAGARKTLEAHRPGLAISAYHTPHHLWQIPRLLADMALGYRFFLRAHMHQGFDTVLYALPSGN